MQLDFTGDYKTKFKAYVDYVLETAALTERPIRMQMIGELTDEYVAQTGDRPDPSELERLANAALYEELSDRRPDKVTLEEYPILSERQYKLRATGQRRERRVDGTVLTEVSMDSARNVGTDGIDYTPAKRSFHNDW